MIIDHIQPRCDPSRGLGYRFDPIPTALKDDRRRGHLIDRDLLVASEMIAIGAWSGRHDSCWCTKAVLAQRLGVTTKTIQSSWARLRARGWIIEHAVGPVDPDDPRNRTRRRYFFGWIAPAGDAPDPPREKGVSPGGGKPVAPNPRSNPIPEQTTGVVVPSEPKTELDMPPAGDGRAEAPEIPAVVAATDAAGLPEPLDAIISGEAIDEPLRRKLGQAIPRWLASHPVERVASAIRALLAARRRRRVRNPIGYLIGTLRNLEAEGNQPTELSPPPPPRRAPDADRTAERLSELRREQALAAERERRWRALPGADREAIEARVDAECARPVGVPTRLWLLTRHAACLERLEARQGLGSEGAMVNGSAVGADISPGAFRV